MRLKLLQSQVKELFIKHPRESGETYLQHMRAAWKIVFFLKKIEAKCVIHSVFPFLYTTAVSDKIECLKTMTSRKNSENEEDLYEVYGRE